MATYTSNFSSGWASLNVEVTTQSQSVADNSSYLKCVMYIHKISSCSSYNLGGATVALNINGNTLYSSDSIDIRNLAVGSNQILCTKYITVYHNGDGTKSVSCSGYIASGVGLGTASTTGTYTCSTIPRQATITSATSFNDEENPTIYYSNNAGNNVSALQACISLDGSTDDISYRDISKSESQYTFELTDDERNLLINSCTTANSRNVTFIIRTKFTDANCYSEMTKTFNIINANPTLEVSVKDTNKDTVDLTGDETIIVKGKSSMTASATAQALKGATITSYKITNGNKVINSNSGEFTNVENDTFNFSVTDSRGNTTTQTVVCSIVDYFDATINFEANITVDGEINVNISGNYFNGKFGSKSNYINVYYRYKTYGGDYSSWKSATRTLSGNTYKAYSTVTGLDYKSKYIVQARAYDRLTTKVSNEITLNCLPVFDWSETDFHFNVPIYVQGNPLIDLIYPVGSIYMSVNNTNPGLLIGGSWEEWGKGCVPVGVDENDTDFSTVEKTGGEKKHTLTKSEVPNATGAITFHGSGSNGTSVQGTEGVFSNGTSINGYSYNAKTGAWSVGKVNLDLGFGGGSHNNIQPYITCYMWKRVA